MGVWSVFRSPAEPFQTKASVAETAGSQTKLSVTLLGSVSKLMNDCHFIIILIIFRFY